MKTYWYYRPEENFPPPISESVSSVSRDGRLCLSVRQNSSPHQERKLKKSWISSLQANHDIRTLWLPFKVNQELFDAACSIPSLEGLWIKWSGIKNIDRITALSNLKYFHLGSSTALEDINPIQSCSRLEWLETENLKRITDFTFLIGLTNLEGLAIDGSMWTTQKIDSLDSIGYLAGLRYLSLANTRAKSGTLRPLLRLSNLETLHLAQWWPDDEVSELYRQLPKLKKIAKRERKLATIASPHRVMDNEDNRMSDEGVPPEFWERADQVIALANEQIKGSTIGKVSSSLLYAAARFGAFNVASSADNLDEMKRNKEEAIKYFTGQYKKMLAENLDEYIENYEKYNTHG